MRFICCFKIISWMYHARRALRKLNRNREWRSARSEIEAAPVPPSSVRYWNALWKLSVCQASRREMRDNWWMFREEFRTCRVELALQRSRLTIMILRTWISGINLSRNVYLWTNKIQFTGFWEVTTCISCNCSSFYNSSILSLLKCQFLWQNWH